IEIKQYADTLHQKHIDAANPHSQYAFKHSPTLTGIPTAPTPAQETDDQQIATTEFVRTWINFLKGDVPVELGSLKALADALDTKLAKDSNGSDIPNKPLFAQNIGVYNKAESDSRYLRAQDNLPVGIPLPWPLATPPTGWIICNGQAFDKAHCPQLALAYPSGVLPDLRGLFIRGWDNGRNLDGGRTLLSFQGDAIRNITGFYIQNLAGNSYWNGCGGAFYQEGNAFGHHANNSGGNGATTKRFDASRVVPTANENRPVNMAFNYIVRAA
ncbi:phage tail protein, partial [Yersinia enterocolitica]